MITKSIEINYQCKALYQTTIMLISVLSRSNPDPWHHTYYCSSIGEPKSSILRRFQHSSLHISITLTVCYKSFLPLILGELFEGVKTRERGRAGQPKIFPHFLLVCGLKKKFHENDMLLRFGQSKPKPSQQLQHHIKQGKRAKQQILHDVAKMILYKAYHLGHGLGLIMVILHQHTTDQN